MTTPPRLTSAEAKLLRRELKALAELVEQISREQVEFTMRLKAWLETRP
jgi:hypothetical protein